MAVIEVTSLGELMFRLFVNDIWPASSVQVYLGLSFGEGRARKMVAHLWQDRMGC